MNNFLKAFSYVMVDEGGYTNDPNDSGGPTNWGITQDDYSRWLKRPASIYDVKVMTSDVAEQIYRDYYWDPLSLDSVVDYGKACAIFDIGVVCGLRTGVLMAQRALNEIGASLVLDGHLGPLTLQALNQVASTIFIRHFEDIVEERFKGIAATNPKDEVFLKGWLNRARRLLTLVQN